MRDQSMQKGLPNMLKSPDGSLPIHNSFYGITIHRPAEMVNLALAKAGKQNSETRTGVIIDNNIARSMKMPDNFIALTGQEGELVWKLLGGPKDIHPPVAPRDFGDLVRSLIQNRDSDRAAIRGELEYYMKDYRKGKEGDGEPEIQAHANSFIRMLVRVAEKRVFDALECRNSLDRQIELAREEKNLFVKMHEANLATAKQELDRQENTWIKDLEDRKDLSKLSTWAKILAAPFIGITSYTLGEVSKLISKLPEPVLIAAGAAILAISVLVPVGLPKYIRSQITKVTNRFNGKKNEVQTDYTTKILNVESEAAQKIERLEKTWKGKIDEASIYATVQAFRITLALYPDFAEAEARALGIGVPDFRTFDNVKNAEAIKQIVAEFQKAIESQVPDGLFNIDLAKT